MLVQAELTRAHAARQQEREPMAAVMLAQRRDHAARRVAVSRTAVRRIRDHEPGRSGRNERIDLRGLEAQQLAHAHALGVAARALDRAPIAIEADDRCGY